MSIQANEVIWRKATVMNPDSPSNGGRMTATAIANNVKNNLWPDVPHSERVAGSTKNMKVFIHIANDEDRALIRPRVFVETATPGDDAVVIFPGTYTDTQSGIAPARVYGAGRLAVSVIGGATAVQVNTEGAALDYFKPGDLIRISNKATVDAVAGTVEYATIASGGVSYSGNTATLTLTGALVNAYSNADTKVASVYEPADIVGGYENVGGAMGSGLFDPADGGLVVDSIGGVYDEWTITFTSATAFTCAGSATGSVGTGNTSSAFSPANASLSRPYFVLNTDAWGGSFAAGNTVTFRTIPAALPLWYRRIIPANAGSLSGNLVTVAIDGESQ